MFTLGERREKMFKLDEKEKKCSIWVRGEKKVRSPIVHVLGAPGPKCPGPNLPRTDQNNQIEMVGKQYP